MLFYIEFVWFDHATMTDMEPYVAVFLEKGIIASHHSDHMRQIMYEALKQTTPKLYANTEVRVFQIDDDGRVVKATNFWWRASITSDTPGSWEESDITDCVGLYLTT